MPNNLPKSPHSNTKVPGSSGTTTGRMVSPYAFLTRHEIMLAFSMYAKARAEGRCDFAERYADAVTRPNLERINIALGQQNDPLYLAYAMEAVVAAATQDGSRGL